MSYQDQHALTNDPDFRGRVSMCVSEQAKIFTNDGRPEYYMIARSAIAALAPITDQFVPLVATQPGMSTEATDGDILSAVQTLWPQVGAPFAEAP